MRQRFSVLFLSLLATHLAWASGDTDNTGALWTEVGVTKALPYNLSIDAGMGYRTLDWFDESSRWDIGAGLSWKLNRHWKFGAGYMFIMKNNPEETSYKTSEELEYKYRDAATNVDWDSESFLGNPYTDAEGNTSKYRGYNDKLKNDTRVDESFWRQKHRVYADVTYTTKFWKTLRISVRERYQLTMAPSKTIDRTRHRIATVTKYRDPSYDGDGNLTAYDEVTKYWQEGNVIYGQDVTDASNPGAVQDVTTAYLAEHNALNTTETYSHEKRRKTLHILRSRLKLSIDKKGWKWEPYVSVETHNNLGDKWNLDKVRTILGVEYNINRHHNLDFGYVFNHENDEDGNQNIHAISIGYNYKF